MTHSPVARHILFGGMLQEFRSVPAAMAHLFGALLGGASTWQEIRAATYNQVRGITCTSHSEHIARYGL